MAILRTDIERALDELIANEEGMRFQALAVVLAKKKWPELIASERHNNSGLDAYTPASIAEGRKAKGVASSITGTIDKVRGDGTKAKKNFPDVEVLIFMTPKKVTNPTAHRAGAGTAHCSGSAAWCGQDHYVSANHGLHYRR